jgi:hypothetical protein
LYQPLTDQVGLVPGQQLHLQRGSPGGCQNALAELTIKSNGDAMKNFSPQKYKR